MSIDRKIADIFGTGADATIEHDRDTFHLQGHDDTGTASKSMRFEMRLTGDGVILRYFVIDYAVDQSTGLKPEEISYDYDQLYEWAQRRKPGLTDDEINRFLANTIAIWEKIGMPTEGSKEFSESGERLNWIPIGTKYIDDNFENLFDITPIADEILDDALSPLLAA